MRTSLYRTYIYNYSLSERNDNNPLLLSLCRDYGFPATVILRTADILDP